MATATTALSASLDGGGVVIPTGVVQDLFVPFACTIVANTMLADQTGTIAIDIWKAPYGSFPPTVANTIVASATPTITNAVSSQDNILSGWTTGVAAGDTLRFSVSTAVTVTRCIVELTVTK